ncbi:hypothetical protein OWR28_12665 [Chryseobacterium sp. 1B4]
MKIRFTIYSLMLGSLMFAQENLDFSGKKEIISPEIKGKSVTFRLRAPEAKTVKLQGNWMSGKGWEPGTVELKKMQMESGPSLKMIWLLISIPIHLLWMV